MFTLYIAKDKRNHRRHDLGSVLCLKTLQHIPRGEVKTVDCDDLTSRPSFLSGTPTLVDESTGEMYTGHNALDRLQMLSLYHAEQYGASQTNNEPEKPKKRENPVERNVETAETDDLWESTIDATSQEDEPVGERKLTSDDLARVVSERQTSVQSIGTKNPPPPPLKPLDD